MEEQGTSDLKKVLVLSLNNSILVRSTRTSSLMKDAMLREVNIKCIRHIFPTFIRMKNMSNQFVKQLNGWKNLILGFEQVNLNSLAVINQSHKNRKSNKEVIGQVPTH